jgi:uncharacterized protein YegL
MVFDPKRFKTDEAKPLPIILLLDCSGSMSSPIPDIEGGHNTRIQTLNTAVKKMLKTLSGQENNTVKFLTSIISFGGDAKLFIDSKNASEIEFSDLQASSMTPLGAALKIAKDLIENKEKVPSRAFRPTVVLVSDGEPNDAWEAPLENFIKEGRTAKCDRWAMGIGNEAGNYALQKFIEGTENRVINANDAEGILDFFKMVTMSVSVRSVSQNPNVIPNSIKNDADSISNNDIDAFF